MSFFNRFDRHAHLMMRMADTLGVDLEGEMYSGALSPTTYRDMVMRCVSCEKADSCAHWLDEQRGEADVAPSYCKNRTTFGSYSF